MAAPLARRLERLERIAAEASRQKWDAAIRALRDSMVLEHRRVVATWLNGRCGGTIGPTFRPGDTWHDVLERYRPPALVRALWLILAEHAHRGRPVSLAPSVARVYLNDPDAVPSNPCQACGYLLPARARVRPDGRYRRLAGVYVGECPACGLDTHPSEEAAR